MTTRQPLITEPSRRSFLRSAAVAGTAMSVLGGAFAKKVYASGEAVARPQTGNGSWTYSVDTHWGELPQHLSYGGTHGAIATDNAGNVYVSTQSETGVLVYTPQGHLLRQVATQFPEIHSLVHAVEGGEELFYATVQKGTPEANWLFLKLSIDGSVLQRIGAPPEAGFARPNEWRITAAVPGPDGSVYIANGYGDSRIFRFARNGSYLGSFGEKGHAAGQFDCSHGLAVDTRFDQPVLLVCDRENRRLCHFDCDGKYVATLAQHLRRPCQVSISGDHMLVSELEGRATIFDRDHVPVAFLGDNADTSQWANYDLRPGRIAPTAFSAAHGCFWAPGGEIYISDWNKTGRVSRLARI